MPKRVRLKGSKAKGAKWLPFASHRLRELKKRFAGNWEKKTFIRVAGAEIEIHSVGAHDKIVIDVGVPVVGSLGSTSSGFRYYTFDRNRPYKRLKQSKFEDSLPISDRTGITIFAPDSFFAPYPLGDSTAIQNSYLQQFGSGALEIQRVSYRPLPKNFIKRNLPVYGQDLATLTIDSFNGTPIGGDGGASPDYPTTPGPNVFAVLAGGGLVDDGRNAVLTTLVGLTYPGPVTNAAIFYPQYSLTIDGGLTWVDAQAYPDDADPLINTYFSVYGGSLYPVGNDKYMGISCVHKTYEDDDYVDPGTPPPDLTIIRGSVTSSLSLTESSGQDISDDIAALLSADDQIFGSLSFVIAAVNTNIVNFGGGNVLACMLVLSNPTGMSPYPKANFIDVMFSDHGATYVGASVFTRRRASVSDITAHPLFPVVFFPGCALRWDYTDEEDVTAILKRTTDGGATWGAVTFPYEARINRVSRIALIRAGETVDDCVLGMIISKIPSTTEQGWVVSRDGGQTWELKKVFNFEALGADDSTTAFNFPNPHMVGLTKYPPVPPSGILE